jgi:hypothetical protein
MQMNHTTKTLAITVGMLAIAAALIGAVGISIAVQSAAADPRNSIDYEKSETDFSFKQKLKNNCSGFATCDNRATETLGAVR